jgi:sialic acid synthase SpsE
MQRIVVEFGSGNTCKNDRGRIREMIDAVDSLDGQQREIVFKWQLFKSAPPNVPMTHEAFVFAWQYAWGRGYKTTASVFDTESLDFLLRFDVPFIKIACRPQLYELAKNIRVPVYMSFSDMVSASNYEVTPMACVPEYPATLEEYERRFSAADLQRAVSDHSPGWDLFWKWRPGIIEKHVVDFREDGNPDAGPFAVTIDELSEVIS